MADKRIKTNHPGVTYIEHKTRKHQGRPDRNYFVRYRNRLTGKQLEEPVGWASQWMNPTKAIKIRSTLLNNIRDGIPPHTYREMREMNYKQYEEEKATRAEEERKNTPFKVVAEEYMSGLKGDHRKSCRSRYKNHIAPKFDSVNYSV